MVKPNPRDGNGNVGNPNGPGKNQVALDTPGVYVDGIEPKNAVVLGTDDSVNFADMSLGEQEALYDAALERGLIALDGEDDDCVDLAVAGAYAIWDNGNGSIGDVVDLGDGNDVMWAFGGNDVVFAGTGNDVVNGGDGTDLLLGEDGNDVLRGDAGQDTLLGGADNDVLQGGDDGDDLCGGEGNDVLQGEDGADFLVGGAGDDNIDGGEGDDTASFDGDVDDYTITVEVDDDFNRTFTVTGPDGTDTVRNVETLLFDDGSIDLDAPVLVFDENGAFVGTEATIQAGVDASAAGYTLLLGDLTFTAGAIIDVPLTIVGSGKTQTVIEPASGNGFTIADLSGFGVDADVSFAGLTVQNAGTDASGILVPTGSGMDTLTITDSSFADNGANGVAVFGDNVANVVIEDSEFTGNGGDATSAGDGDVLFYQYEGDATLTNVSVTGDGTADNGIQFRDDDGSMGSVTLTDVTIEGTYERAPLAVYNYDDISGLSITGMVITAVGTDFGPAVNFDGIGGTIDYASLGIDTSGSPGLVMLQGDGTDNTIIAGDIDTANPDGDAFLRGYDGDDTFVLGEGIEAVLGGDFGSDTGTDTASYQNSDAAVDVDLSLGLATQSGGDAEGDILLGIENLIGSAQADALAGTSGANEIEGGDGADAILGGAGADVLFGGDGGDNDTINAGTSTGPALGGGYDGRDGDVDIIVAADSFAENGTDLVENYEEDSFFAPTDGIDDIFDFSGFVDTSAATNQTERELAVNAALEFDVANSQIDDSGGNAWFQISELGAVQNDAEKVTVLVDGYLYEATIGDPNFDEAGLFV